MSFSTQVAEQAVHWLMEMQQGALNPRQQAAWQQWLNAHSEHQRAWDHMQRVNQRLRGMPSPLAHAALNAPTSTSRRQALKLLLTPEGLRSVDPAVMTCTGDNCPKLVICPGPECSFAIIKK